MVVNLETVISGIFKENRIESAGRSYIYLYHLFNKHIGSVDLTFLYLSFNILNDKNKVIALQDGSYHKVPYCTIDMEFQISVSGFTVLLTSFQTVVQGYYLPETPPV